MATVIALSEAIKECGVEFAIVGGVAVSLVGRPRFTADVDAVLWDVDQRLSALIECLGSKGFHLRCENSMDIARRSRVILLEDERSVGIDLSMGILPFERWMIDGARWVKTERVSIPVASPEALIVMKSIAWRAKDLEDIREVVAANPDLDRTVVLSYAEEFFALLEQPERVLMLRSLLV